MYDKLTEELFDDLADGLLKSMEKENKKWVIYPPIDHVTALGMASLSDNDLGELIRNSDSVTISRRMSRKTETMEDKIEKKVARFLELSIKFSKQKEEIEEIQELLNIKSTTKGTSVTLTASGNPWGVQQPHNEDPISPRSEKDSIMAGVNERLKVYAEYSEYVELQNTLNEYFKAKKAI